MLTHSDYGAEMKKYYWRYPDAGYGGSFHTWVRDDGQEPYNSWGNGSAMRTSCVGYAYNSLDEVLNKAKQYASFTHNHPEGVKGAQATSASIFLGRNGVSKKDIKSYIVNEFAYDLSKSIDEIRPDYSFDVSCQGSVPQAITAFLESTSYEDAIRNSISIGGDTDTLACITGGIAEAFYGGIPEPVREKVLSILDPDLRKVVSRFVDQYG